MRRFLSSVLALVLMACLAAYAQSPLPSAGRYPQLLGAPRPPGFEAIQAYGEVVRVRDLPLRTYNTDSRFSQVFAAAIGHWNAAAHSCSLPDVFVAVDDPQEADFAIDWTSRGLSSRDLAVTRTTIGMLSAHVLGIVMRGDTRIPPGNMCEVLMQELGHVLGLGHSEDPRDIMYGRAHREFRPLERVALTPRDVSMLSWLYAQENAIFILHKAR